MGCAICSGSVSGVTKIAIDNTLKKDEETIQHQEEAINCIDRERISIQSNEQMIHVGSSYVSSGGWKLEKTISIESPHEMMIRREIEKKKKLDREQKSIMRIMIQQEKYKKAPKLDVSTNQLYLNRVSPNT